MTGAAVYLRVSGVRQDEKNQEPECLQLCSARGWPVQVFRERLSGVKRRPEWDRLKEQVRRGHVRAVVFWALDRTGRNAVQIAHDIAELWRWGAAVVSVRDAWVDQPPGPLRDLMLQIMAWVAQSERARLIERTQAGLQRAKGRGVQLGRPQKYDPDVKAAALKINASNPGFTCGQVARALAGAVSGQKAVPKETIRSWLENEGRTFAKGVKHGGEASP